MDNERVWIVDLWDALQRHRRLSPARLIALSFALAIFLGTILLALPFSHAPGQSVGIIDAFFTATSAVCVTGLIVVDTGSAYNLFGQGVIMLLIQTGGLGLITFSTMVALVSGRRIGFSERIRIQTQVNALQVGGVVNLIRRIVFFVFVAELLGALLLYVRFSELEGERMGVFYALFHSISAFNNAGFSFYADSLSSFVTDPLVNFTIIALIIFGGLGFFVIFEGVLQIFRRRRRPWSLHSKLVLTTTGFLLLIGFFIFAFFEWTNPETLGRLSFLQKLQASLFLSVTPRTAGFNTLDYGAMRSSTLLTTMLLMFIGGSPGSTAGGIKTVTFFVIIGSAWSMSRGHGELTIFGRRIGFETVIRASVISFFGIMLAGAALTLLLFTEPHLDPFKLGFEVISAVGTVGLSTGITGGLSLVGKLIVIVLMYLGRLGPLTFAVALIEKSADKHITYPVEEIIIG